MKQPQKIYRDKTGQYRPVNPHPEFKEACIAHDIEFYKNPDWLQFEQSITYHEFPNAPDTNEIVEAYLQDQWMCHSTWVNIDSIAEFKVKFPNAAYRQIWVAASQEAKEEQLINVIAGNSNGFQVWDKNSMQWMTVFTGKIQATLEWVVYDHNEGYEEWTTATHPECDKANGYRTKQVYLADFSNIKPPSAPKVEVSAEKEAEERYPFVYTDLDGPVVRHQSKMKTLEKRLNFIAGANWQADQLQAELQDKEKEIERLKEIIDKALQGHEQILSELSRLKIINEQK